MFTINLEIICHAYTMNTLYYLPPVSVYLTILRIIFERDASVNTNVAL